MTIAKLSRLVAASLVALVGLGAAASSARADLRIIATIPDLGALAKAVGKDHVSVKVLAAATEDPHFVDPRPSYLVDLSKADALVYNGLDLEIGWLPPLISNARNAKILVGMVGNIDASTYVTKKLQVPSGRIDRSMGDVHPGGNPHFGYGPDQMSDIARGIGVKLGQLDPANAAEYKANADAFVGRLQELATAEKARFAGLTAAQRKIVSYHESLVYLVAWLGLDQVATVEDRPGIKPSPGHVGDVLARMKGDGVHAILQEEFHPDATSNSLAKLAGARVVRLPGGSRAATADGYLDYLKGIADTIYGVLAQ